MSVIKRSPVIDGLKKNFSGVDGGTKKRKRFPPSVFSLRGCVGPVSLGGCGFRAERGVV